MATLSAVTATQKAGQTDVVFDLSWTAPADGGDFTLANYDVKFYVNDTSASTNLAVYKVDGVENPARTFTAEVSKISDNTDLVAGDVYGFWAVLVPKSTAPAGTKTLSSAISHVKAGDAPTLLQDNFEILPGENSVEFKFNNLTQALKGYKTISKIELILAETGQRLGAQAVAPIVLNFLAANITKSNNDETLTVNVVDGDGDLQWDIPAGVRCDATATIFNELGNSESRLKSFVYSAAPAEPSNLALSILTNADGQKLGAGEMFFSFDNTVVNYDPAATKWNARLYNSADGTTKGALVAGSEVSGDYDANVGSVTFTGLQSGQFYIAEAQSVRLATPDETGFTEKVSAFASVSKRYYNLAHSDMTISTSQANLESDVVVKILFPEEAKDNGDDIVYENVVLTVQADHEAGGNLTAANAALDAIGMGDPAWSYDGATGLLTKTIPTGPAGLSDWAVSDGSLTNFITEDLPFTVGFFLNYKVSGVLSAKYTEGATVENFQVGSNTAEFMPKTTLEAPSQPVVSALGADGAPLSQYVDGAWKGYIRVEFTELTERIEGADVSYEIYAQEWNGAALVAGTKVLVGTGSNASDDAEQAPLDANQNDLSFTVPNAGAAAGAALSVDKQYKITVKGKFEDQTSDASDASDAVSPFGQPRAVTNMQVVGNGLEAANLTFNGSADYLNGAGVDITSYKLTVKKQAGAADAVDVDFNILAKEADEFGDATFVAAGVADALKLINPNPNAALPAQGAAASPYVVESTAQGAFSVSITFAAGVINPGDSVIAKLETVYAQSTSYASATATASAQSPPIIVGDPGATFTSSAANTSHTIEVNNNGAALREIIAVAIPAELDAAPVPVLNLTGAALAAIAGTQSTDGLAYDLVLSFPDGNGGIYNQPLSQIFLVLESATGIASGTLDKAE